MSAAVGIGIAVTVIVLSALICHRVIGAIKRSGR